MKVLIYSAGSAIPSPGPAAGGAVLRDPATKRRLRTVGHYIGTATGNEAHWAGLIRGLRAAREIGATSAVVHSNCELVIKQASGVWRCHDSRMRFWHDVAQGIAREFERVDYLIVPRYETKEAHTAAKAAARQKTKDFAYQRGEQ